MPGQPAGTAQPAAGRRLPASARRVPGSGSAADGAAPPPTYLCAALAHLQHLVQVAPGAHYLPADLTSAVPLTPLDQHLCWHAAGGPGLPEGAKLAQALGDDLKSAMVAGNGGQATLCLMSASCLPMTAQCTRHKALLPLLNPPMAHHHSQHCRINGREDMRLKAVKCCNWLNMHALCKHLGK
jgi:hypothetical protein